MNENVGFIFTWLQQAQELAQAREAAFQERQQRQKTTNQNVQRRR